MTQPHNPATIAVFGHKTPDTDAIVSAIAMSEWLNQQGIAATPYRLGEINKETHYLLNLASAQTPPLLSHLPKGSPIALTDHNESQQSIDNRQDYEIRYVIDHHKLGDLTTSEPAYIRLQPVGSTCTLLFLMFYELKKSSLSAQLATLMLGAIVSDTLNLTSPTTTESDKLAVAKLATIADIENINDFAKNLFNAKSDVSDLTAIELITADYKQFSFGKQPQKWGIAVIETVNPSQIFARITELQTAIDTVKTRDKLDFLLVVIVDILQQQSWAIVVKDDTQNQMIAKAFDSEIKEHLIDLGNLVSRKKQFVPTLENYFSAN